MEPVETSAGNAAPVKRKIAYATAPRKLAEDSDNIECNEAARLLPTGKSWLLDLTCYYGLFYFITVKQGKCHWFAVEISWVLFLICADVNIATSTDMSQ